MDDEFWIYEPINGRSDDLYRYRPARGDIRVWHRLKRSWTPTGLTIADLHGLGGDTGFRRIPDGDLEAEMRRLGVLDE